MSVVLLQKQRQNEHEKSQFSEEEKIGILRQVRGDPKSAELKS
jgi:hypothetical protein